LTGKSVAEGHEPDSGRGALCEVFRVFLKLGLTSFGGPIAHLGYFRAELVARRKWIDEAGYADLIALCQFLPGPASSQVGFSLGVLRGGGMLGGLAAWLGFTLPSALILLAFALGASDLTGPVAQGALHGLKLVAVAVVAQALWGMARTLTPDRTRIAMALASIAIVVGLAGAFGQIFAIAAGAAAGVYLCRDTDAAVVGRLRFPVSHRNGVAALILFGIFLLVPPLIGGAGTALFNAFYRSGALVFGGGHVVLPLLHAAVVAPGWVTDQAFLAGYGLTQAAPGPLFTFAVYLGAISDMPPHGATGASIALVAIFLPGLLLVYGMLPFWDALRQRRAARAAMRGANAAVVGILAAAFYDPVWTGAVRAPLDFALALGGFLMLTVWKIPPWVVVLLLAVIGAVFGARAFEGLL
jgi:chromate transporter